MVNSFILFWKQNKANQPSAEPKFTYPFMNLAPGRHLRNIREKLLLKYRDVKEASHQIALRNKNPEFSIGLSRLADIENKGTVPSIYRMYSLAAIYGRDFTELLGLYGVSVENMIRDVADLEMEVTKPVNIIPSLQAPIAVPHALLTGIDVRKTSFLSRQIQNWGILPLYFLQTLDLDHHRYALVGSEDWSMYPLIPPGSFVQIDETKRKIANSGWDNDLSRPIYFLEFRSGYGFGWCTERAGMLIVQPHSSAPLPAAAYRFPGEVEVLGQVVAVAMRLDRSKQRRKRSS